MESLPFDEKFVLNLPNLKQDGMIVAKTSYLCSMKFKIV